MKKILTVEDTFMIAGRGLAVTGWIDGEPEIKVGDLVKIVRPDQTKIETQIRGIEKFRICFGEETARRSFGFLLNEVKKSDIPRGSEIFVFEK